MKLSQWAKEQGLTYKGAWRMWRAGQLPVPAEQLPTGTIIVKEIKTPAHAVGLYARVSRSDQKKDLEAQLGRLVVYADSHRLTIVQAVSEVGFRPEGTPPQAHKTAGQPEDPDHRGRASRPVNALRRRVCRGRPYRPGAQAPGHGKLRGQR